jgi:hypothetical protein
VYDMYPWDSASPGERPPGTPRVRGDYPSPLTPLALAWAVQFALDRRDNGGDAAGVAGQAAPSPARQ